MVFYLHAALASEHTLWKLNDKINAGDFFLYHVFDVIMKEFPNLVEPVGWREQMCKWADIMNGQEGEEQELKHINWP